MTTTADHLARVAARIGKKPEEVWPGWYQRRESYSAIFDTRGNPKRGEFTGTYRHTGPDLTDPRNLNDALGVLRVATGDSRWSLRYRPPFNDYEIEIVDGRWFGSEGETPTAAVIAAIEEACK